MRCPFLPLLDAFGHLLGRLPQPAVLALGRLLAFVGRPWLRSRRRIARTNIDLCFPALPPAGRARLADASVENAAIGVFELVRAWFTPAPRLARLGTVEGIDALRDALGRGGVVLLGSHMTHVELGIRLLGDALGRPLHVLARRHNRACLEAWIDRSRHRVFAATIDKKDVRGLLRALQAGEPVIYLSDQDFSYQNAFVPFFGVPAATLTALPDIVRRGRATMLPFWTHRDDAGRYHVRIGPAWDGWPSGDPVRDAARYMSELETRVRVVPEQYLWVHKRFKTRPPGEPSPY